MGFAGQIENFRGPHLAHGPYVVHAWSKQSVRENLITLDTTNLAPRISRMVRDPAEDPGRGSAFG